MPTIKFSHLYPKLRRLGSQEPFRSAVLLDVFIYDLSELSDEFKAYDTDNGLYELPKKGLYMLLLFKPNGSHQIFPTLRRWTKSKEDYYTTNIGKEFRIVINEGE